MLKTLNLSAVKFVFDMKCVVKMVLAASCEKGSFVFGRCIGFISHYFKGDAAFEIFKPLLPTFVDVYPVI